MKKILLLKLIKYFDRQQAGKGFTLIELLVVVILIGIMSAVALPTLFGQVEKARVAEAKNTLGMLNRAQQAYYFEKAFFASNLSDLGADISIGSVLYNYSFVTPVDNTQVRHLATPQPLYQGDISYVTSAVFRTGGNFTFALCQGNDPAISPTIVDATTCNNGTFVNK
ncbi:MAG: hypothetical protein Tsb0014_29370 [Pleurocapsa sp.]